MRKEIKNERKRGKLDRKASGKVKKRKNMEKRGLFEEKLSQMRREGLGKEGKEIKTEGKERMRKKKRKRGRLNLRKGNGKSYGESKNENY